ncbi:glycoside-pentoside-hexuronide (GPH):cation symporter [Lachnospiraceae bacterium ZAX-1]
MTETITENTAGNSLSDRKTSLRENLTYGLTAVAENPIYTIMISFLIFFYTDVIGINAGIVGTIILISKFFDGLSDVIAGNIVDHTHTKAGSARPWYLRLAIPMVFAYIILFTVPNVGTVGKAAYIFISYNLVSTIIYTMLSAVMNALPAFITENRNSRSVMLSIRVLIGAITQMGITVAILPLVEKLGGGQGGWVKMAAILGIVSAVVLIFIYFHTKETAIDPSADDAGDSDVPLLTAIKSLLKNKYWLICLLMYFINILTQVAILTVGVYYAKYVLHDENLIANLTLYFFPGALICMCFVPAILSKGISKRILCIMSMVVLIFGSLLTMIPSSSGAFFIIGLVLRGIGFGVISSAAPGMILETIVYGEWKTGYNIPSVTLTALGVGQKVGSGIGTALLGIVLSICGYDGLAATQPPSAVSAISFIYVFLPAVLSVFIIICMYFFKLDSEYPKYVEELKQRKEKQLADE